MEYRLNTKGLERNSVIEGVRHFENRKDAMTYVALKYNIVMHYNSEIPGQVRAYYEGDYVDDSNHLWTAETPAGEWQDDHDVLEIYKDEKLVEFVTYADAYTYEFMHSREYDFIKTV